MAGLLDTLPERLRAGARPSPQPAWLAPMLATLTERPFSERELLQDRAVRNANWIKPHLVAQVAFTEWTRDGRLRHPRFLGLRADKPPTKVVRERPA